MIFHKITAQVFLVLLTPYLIHGVRAVEIAELEQCLETIQNNTSWDDICQSPDNFATSLEQGVRKHFSTCLNENLARTLRITVPNASLLPAIRRHALEFQAKYNVSVKLNVLEVLNIATEVRGEAQSQLQDFSDGWIVDPSVTGDLAAANALANLTSYVFADQDLDWSDVSKFFRMVSAYYNKRIIGLPLDGDLLLMYYRRDLFERYNLSVPATWEEFAELAGKMNGTDTDGDGVGDLWGACIDNTQPTCKSLWILTAILAPYVQYLGTKQGVFIDPATMKPLMNNPAMIRAVQLYRSLFASGPRPAECRAANPFFSNGSCLMTINFGDQFKVSAQVTANNSNRQFNGSMLGISRLPGSLEVLNRTTDTLVTCTHDTCPYAQLVRLANGTKAWVNFAPFSAFGGWTGLVNARATQINQLWAFKFFSYISQPNNNIGDVLDPTSGIDPYRTSQLQPSPENLARWAAKGYDINATLEYLLTTRDALDYENMVLDVRLRSMADVTRFVLATVADNTTWGKQAIDQILIWGQNLMEFELNYSKTNLRDLQIQYWQLIGYSPSDDRGPRPNQKPESNSTNSNNVSHGSGDIVEMAVLIPVGTVLMAVGACLLVWRRVSGHRSLLYGSVKAPMAGQQTTLLITDIQDSTSLWEVLPDVIMDAALKVHHTVVRQALAKHVGYESATEGDSFILAFHSAEDAVACAMRIQMDLLTAKWPPDLLRCTDCLSAAEVWVGPARGALQQHCALLDMLGGSIRCETRDRCWTFHRTMVGDFCNAVARAPWRLLDGCRGGAPMWRSSRTLLKRRATACNMQPQQQLTQQPVQSLKAPQAIAATNGVAINIKSPDVAMAAATTAMPGTATEKDDPDAAGRLKHQISEEEQRQLSAHQFWRLSTTSGMLGEDDTTVVATSYWSTLQEGMLSRGTSSQYRDEAQGASPRWLGALANIFGLIFRSRGQPMHHNQQYQYLIPPVFVSTGDKKSEQQNGKSSLNGGAPCTTTAGVLNAAATGTGTTGPGATAGPGSGRLFKEHIRSIWFVVDLGRCTFRNVDTDTIIPPSSGTGGELQSSRSSKDGTIAARANIETTLLAPTSASVPVQPTRGNIVGGADGHKNQVLKPTASSGDTQLLQHGATEVEMSEIAITGGSKNKLLLPHQEQPLQPPSQRIRISQPQQINLVDDSAVANPASRQHAVRQLLAFRGLRVRMGIHSGVPDSEHVLYNQAEARYQYSGVGMVLARAVQGAAAGGQVLLSDSTFALVRDGRRAKRLRDAVLIHAGEHVLDTKLPAAQQIYQALPRQLLCRLALQPPLKVLRTVAAGALDAPVGRVAVAFLTVVGAATLQSWNAEIMQQALGVFQAVFWTAAAANATRGAYLVEFTSEGLLLAAFASTADALATCMAVQSDLLVAEWPPELLEHDMCEEVAIATPQPGGTIVREVLFRGLRVKAGVDCGLARASLNGATGRIAYRGRVMNRAARINARGSSGQVLCSRSAWQAASEAEEVGPAARGLAALSLGHVMLKGICEPMEILEVRPLVTAAAPSPGQSTLMGRTMLASPSCGSLAPLASAASMSTVVAGASSLGPTPSVTSRMTLPVVGAPTTQHSTLPDGMVSALGRTNSIRGFVGKMSVHDDANVSIISVDVPTAVSDVSANTSAAVVPVPVAVAVPAAAVMQGVDPGSGQTSTSNPFKTRAATTPSISGGAEIPIGPYRTCPTPIGMVPMTSVSLCNLHQGESRLHQGDNGGMMATAAIATASIGTATATAGASSRNAGDLARLNSDASGAVLLQHSGSSFIGSRLPQALSMTAQLQTAQGLRAAAPESKWLLRASSRRYSGIEQPLPPSLLNAELLLPSSTGATGTLPPPPTVQVFRVDTTTGIAALELPLPSPAPPPPPGALNPPTPAPAPAIMLTHDTTTSSAAVPGCTALPAPHSMMMGATGDVPALASQMGAY
ncbi:hypothetical protein VaNZ11_009149 [Volvox africanus]|uniref:Guanylate cyclase domain-containing protein n=1 Tax=Volvox africanus TaxID=51714 RepID=A0ABQ5S6Q0_9CHLO|nr:hypothetical protein VaNZ11_009149 [Volvox africanus]